MRIVIGFRLGCRSDFKNGFGLTIINCQRIWIVFTILKKWILQNPDFHFMQSRPKTIMGPVVNFISLLLALFCQYFGAKKFQTQNTAL